MNFMESGITRSDRKSRNQESKNCTVRFLTGPNPQIYRESRRSESFFGPVTLTIFDRIYDLREIAKKVMTSFTHFMLWTGLVFLAWMLAQLVTR